MPSRSSSAAASAAARRMRASVDPSERHAPGDSTGGHFAGAAANPGAHDASREPGSDVPFEVRGFATDPKHSGYQILTNYESTYWRAFVGVQAWALYEVLRSFCHNGNNTCYPSINYLLEVLGIKQRRVLTGWSTAVKGKNYDYPGLIEILQSSGLVIAEVVGEGPMQRYLFHVNLTPDLLRPEQVAELPALLQTKHAEMLQAHFAEMAELASRRRPAKTPAPRSGTSSPESTPQNTAETRPNAAADTAQNDLPPRLSMQDSDDSTKNMVENEGMTNCQTPMTNCHTPSDNLSHKQHQYNNTQLTSARSPNLINNNSGGSQQELPTTARQGNLFSDDTDVVVALTELGLADSVVKRLTTRFNRQRILEKIDYLAYLEAHHPNKVKNPRGWLRRAIEENYGAPDGYLPPDARAAQAATSADEETPRTAYTAYVDAAEVAASQAAQASAAAEREYLRASRRELVRRHHAPDAATLAFWELVQTDVRFTMTPDHYRLIADASVLWLDFDPGDGGGHKDAHKDTHKDTHKDAGGTVAIAIWDREIYRELLHPNRVKALARSMSTLAKRKLTLVCEYWDEEGQVVPPGAPPP